MRIAVLIFSAFVFTTCSSSREYNFTYQSVPENSGFKMEGYWVWGGSVIKVDSLYHMFASRWVKNSSFPENYRNSSEIVRATSSSPLGPYRFEEVIIGERDSTFWDSNMAHNPTIHKIGDKYVLFYIGSDFNTFLPGTRSLLRRVGYAVADMITGPWIRSDKPVINTESNNPAILVENDKIMLMYRDQDLKVFLTEAQDFEGPYKMLNNNVWPENKIEDFYLFRTGSRINLICEDNTGVISGHERWGVQLCSDDGGLTWIKHTPLIAYDHDLARGDNHVLRCTRRERPQLLIEDGKITCLITAIYDGENSWCQPVKLAKPVVVKLFTYEKYKRIP